MNDTKANAEFAAEQRNTGLNDINVGQHPYRYRHPDQEAIPSTNGAGTGHTEKTIDTPVERRY